MKVEVEYGETVNIGNFESVRISCRIEEHFNNPEDQKKALNTAFKKAIGFVTKKTQELKE